MDNKIRKIIIFWGIIFAFFLKAGFVLALEMQYPTIMGFSLNDTSTLPEYARYFFNIGIVLAAFIAVIVIAWGGIQYIFTLGLGRLIDPGKGTRAPDEAKEWVKAGIYGLLIVFCAYLIAYTINPDLVAFKLAGFPTIVLQNPLSNSAPPQGADVTTYKEIPLGVLTENLLTRTMDCYGFGPGGDPIDGNQITTGSGGWFSGSQQVAGPTYLDHDRADCLLQLTDGAQKKAQAIAALSDAITNLMNQCDCQKYGNCTNSCNNGGNGCIVPGSGSPSGIGGQCNNKVKCAGPCVGASCQQPNGAQPGDCCPEGVKDKIEHGPIDVGGNGCDTLPKTYNGLDEFRCPTSGPFPQCSGMAGFVEKQVQLDKKTITVIDQSKWKKLNMVQQLTYFKEKINEIKQKIQKDKDDLDRARSILGSPQCYLAIPYVDLLKTYDSTNQEVNIIKINKFSTAENGNVDASKYCNGFNYSNSSCLKKCNDACPDSSSQAMTCYQNCESCDGNNNNPICLNKQETCVEKCYNSRPCINGPNPSQKFSDCINSCQSDCSNNCSEKYLPCSNEYTACQKQCHSNSQCVLDNAGSCLFGASGFKYCADNTTDPGNAKNCISGAYLCRNGSDENAGYKDCAVSASSNCPAQQYSASFFYDNKNCQECPDPYGSLFAGGASCQKLYPETAKCPAASNCPDCPCDQISDTTDSTKPLTLTFSVPNQTSGSYSNVDYPVLAHQVIGPQCNEYSYNDDPLTFYCQVNPPWWKNPNREGNGPTPIGAERTCPKEREVPVGQTVDDAENWADKIISAVDSANQDIQGMLTQAEKAGKAKDTSPVQDYCKCGARLENNNPICATDCRYNQSYITIPVMGNVYVGADPDTGDPIYELQQVDKKQELKCSCAFTPCSGSPCQQAIDYLSQVWNNYRQLKLDFINIYTSMLSEPRSDIIKELTYSRKQTNSCSLVNSAYGTDVRLLDCTRVLGEQIPPFKWGSIDTYCYGIQLGKDSTPASSLTDNWFCCQEQQATNPTSRQGRVQ